MTKALVLVALVFLGSAIDEPRRNGNVLLPSNQSGAYIKSNLGCVHSYLRALDSRFDLSAVSISVVCRTNNEKTVELFPVFNFYNGGKPLAKLTGEHNRRERRHFFCLRIDFDHHAPLIFFSHLSVSIKVNNLFRNQQIKRRLCPDIFGKEVNFYFIRIASVEGGRNFEFDPRPTVLAHDLVSAAHLAQSTPNQINRTETHKQANQASVSHDPSKPGHFFLGVKIKLGTLAILGGFYFLANATSHSRRVKIGPTVAFYPICGLISIGAGDLLIAHSLLG